MSSPSYKYTFLSISEPVVRNRKQNQFSHSLILSFTCLIPQRSAVAGKRCLFIFWLQTDQHVRVLFGFITLALPSFSNLNTKLINKLTSLSWSWKRVVVVIWVIAIIMNGTDIYGASNSLYEQEAESTVQRKSSKKVFPRLKRT